ncbi:MAG: thioredoxin [Pseudomonadales bacterium]|uniref:thioredoxin n=1 Tax=Ekhidna sp. TaxID=2608089 RepID=UPI0032EFBD1B
MSKFNELINGDQPVLVDFHATWCGPCHTMAPILEELKSENGSKARIIKVDIDKNQAAAQKYNVRGVPTFILFKQGKQVWRQSGAIPKHMLEQAINQSA